MCVYSLLIWCRYVSAFALNPTNTFQLCTGSVQTSVYVYAQGPDTLKHSRSNFKRHNRLSRHAFHFILLAWYDIYSTCAAVYPPPPQHTHTSDI